MNRKLILILGDQLSENISSLSDFDKNQDVILMCEVWDEATRWLWTYNNERPNMGIGGITPAMKLAQSANRSTSNQLSTSKHL